MMSKKDRLQPRKTGLHVHEDLDVAVLVVDECQETLVDNLVHLDGLGDHALGVHLALGDDVDDLLEVAVAESSTAKNH